jgi:hypothetical protein
MSFTILQEFFGGNSVNRCQASDYFGVPNQPRRGIPLEFADPLLRQPEQFGHLGLAEFLRSPQFRQASSEIRHAIPL